MPSRITSPALQAAVAPVSPTQKLEEVKAKVTQSKAPPSPTAATAVPRPAPPTPGTGSLGEPRVTKKVVLARAVPVPRKPTRDERVNELSLMPTVKLSALVTKLGIDHTLDKTSKIKAILNAEYAPPSVVAKPQLVNGSPTLTPKPQSVAKTRTFEELQAEVEALLDELRAATDPERKKGIRRALRLRGHRGGLKNVPA